MITFKTLWTSTNIITLAFASVQARDDAFGWKGRTQSFFSIVQMLHIAIEKIHLYSQNSQRKPKYPFVHSQTSFCTHFPPFKHFSVQIPEILFDVKIFILLFNFTEKMLHARGVGVRLASTSAATSPSRKVLDSIIRVDHAGELAADRIYAGQMAVLGILVPRTSTRKRCRCKFWSRFWSRVLIHVKCL